MTNSAAEVPIPPSGEITQLVTELGKATAQVLEAIGRMADGLEPIRAVLTASAQVTESSSVPPPDTPLGSDLREVLGCVEATQDRLGALVSSLRL